MLFLIILVGEKGHVNNTDSLMPAYQITKSLTNRI